jgi:hypothetical protein
MGDVLTKLRAAWAKSAPHLKAGTRATGRGLGKASLFAGKLTGRGILAIIKILPGLIGKLIGYLLWLLGQVLKFFFTGTAGELAAKWAVLLFFFAGWAFLAGKIQMSDKLSELVGYIIAGVVLVTFVTGMTRGGTKRN